MNTAEPTPTACALATARRPFAMTDWSPDA